MVESVVSEIVFPLGTNEESVTEFVKASNAVTITQINVSASTGMKTSLKLSFFTLFALPLPKCLWHCKAFYMWNKNIHYQNREGYTLRQSTEYAYQYSDNTTAYCEYNPTPKCDRGGSIICSHKYSAEHKTAAEQVE